MSLHRIASLLLLLVSPAQFVEEAFLPVVRRQHPYRRLLLILPIRLGSG